MGLALRERAGLLEGLRPCFARVQVWLQAGKYVTALAGGLPRVNGWSIARQAGDRAPDKTQRLLNHASWDEVAAMSVVRRFAVAGLDDAARRIRRAGGMTAGALDETGQEKHGACTAGVKRQYLGCAGRVANGINTVHLAYVREGTGHALIGARQWIPREHISDPVTSLVTGLPVDLRFRTKGQLGIDVAESPPFGRIVAERPHHDDQKHLSHSARDHDAGRPQCRHRSQLEVGVDQEQQDRLHPYGSRGLTEGHQKAGRETR